MIVSTEHQHNLLSFIFSTIDIIGNNYNERILFLNKISEVIDLIDNNDLFEELNSLTGHYPRLIKDIGKSDEVKVIKKAMITFGGYQYYPSFSHTINTLLKGYGIDCDCIHYNTVIRDNLIELSYFKDTELELKYDKLINLQIYFPQLIKETINLK